MITRAVPELPRDDDYEDLERTLKPHVRPGDAAFFLCYRQDQSSFIAHSLQQALAAHFGKGSVFMDKSTIDPGKQWPRAIQEAIVGCGVVLVIIGPYWLTVRDASGKRRRLDDPKDWVRQEVEAGLVRPALIPVLVDGAKMPASGDLPPSLRPMCDRNAFELVGEDFPREVDKLADAIRRRLVGEEPPAERINLRPPSRTSTSEASAIRRLAPGPPDTDDP